MKIIDNKKDYYDYLSGVYGIDPYVVYDRRGSMGSNIILETPGWSDVFSKKEIASDKIPKSNYGRYYNNRPFLDRIFEIVVEAGEKHFYIKCRRYRKTEDSPVEVTYKMYDPLQEINTRYSNTFVKREIERYKKKRSKAPLAIFYTDYGKYHETVGHGEIENPILKDLPITGMLPAEEIWQGIYDYLLKMKEPVIVDSRTNDEHIESAGFDKKTSFRNM